MLRLVVVMLAGLLILTQFSDAVPTAGIVALAVFWALWAVLTGIGKQGRFGSPRSLRVVLAGCACGQHFLTTATPMGTCRTCARSQRDIP